MLLESSKVALAVAESAILEVGVNADSAFTETADSAFISRSKIKKMEGEFEVCNCVKREGEIAREEGREI